MFEGCALELAGDLKLRWQRVQQRIQAAGADGVLVAGNVNLLYLTGRIFMGQLYLPAEGEPWFFVRRPSGLKGERVVAIRKPEQLPELFAEAGMPYPKRLLLEGDELSYSEYQRLSLVFEGCEALNGSPLLRQCRAVKTPYEVRVMRLTGARHAEIVMRFPEVYEPGMTDHQWAVAMFDLMLRSGNLGLFRVAGSSMEAFMGSVLAGDNGGAVSPYDFALGGSGMHPSIPVGSCGVRLEPGMAVMADVVGNFYGYLTDCSRTFSIGRLADEALRAHQVAVEILQRIAEAGVPGVAAVELYELALGMAERAGLGGNFMGLAQQARFVGHGTGLVINELPVIGARSRDLLEPGMCIALEPKFVISGSGAVGVEDTLLVTEQGMENLTPCPYEIVQV